MIEKVTLTVFVTDCVGPGDRVGEIVAVEELDCEFEFDADADFTEDSEARPLDDPVEVREPSAPVGDIKEVTELDLIDDGVAVSVADADGEWVTESVGELVADEVFDPKPVLELV